MNLEDHLGDIVRKARSMSGVSAETAARAGGLSLEQLEALEESGKPIQGISYSGLAAAIGLDGAKLENLAKGWLPVLKDLSTWRELRCITTEAGIQCTLYFPSASVRNSVWPPKPTSTDSCGRRISQGFP